MLLLVPAGVTILPSSAIGIISILAIILGIVGMRKEQKRIATVGIILGVVGIGIFFTFKVLKVAREKAMTEQASTNTQIIDKTVEKKYFENVDTSLLAKEPFVSIDGKFQMNFPDKWTSVPLKSNGGVGLEFSQDSSNEVTVHVSSKPSSMPLIDLVSISKANLQNQGFTFLEDKPVTVAGGDARFLVATIKDSGQVYNQAYLLVSVNGRVYMFVGTAPESKWSDARRNFEAAFSTFQSLQ